MYVNEDLTGLKNAIEWPYLLQNLGFKKINVRTRRCCCLIHGGDNQSAFTWNRDFFHCFSCLRSGDAIELVRVIKRFDFAESVQYLSSLFGLKICNKANKTKKGKKKDWEIPSYIIDRIANQNFELMQIESNIKKINDKISELTKILCNMNKEKNVVPYFCQTIEDRLARLDSDLAYWSYIRNQTLWK